MEKEYLLSIEGGERTAEASCPCQPQSSGNECGARRVCLPLQHKFGVRGGIRLWSEASAKATPDTRQRGVDAGISGGLTLNFCLSHFKRKRKRFLYELQPRKTSIRRDRRKHEVNETSGAFERRPLYPAVCIMERNKIT